MKLNTIREKELIIVILFYLITSIILLGIDFNAVVILSNRSCVRFFIYSSIVVLFERDVKETVYGAWVNISASNMWSEITHWNKNREF